MVTEMLRILNYTDLYYKTKIHQCCNAGIIKLTPWVERGYSGISENLRTLMNGVTKRLVHMVDGQHTIG